MRLIDCFTEVFAYVQFFARIVGDRPAGPAAKETPRPGKAEEKTPSLLSPAERVAKPAAAAEGGAEVFSFDKVQEDLRRLLARAQEEARAGQVGQDDFELARFAVCAWVDERISCSGWKERSRWPKAELQRVYYETTNAGEEFFQYLESLGGSQNEVLEVYATCLDLGFQGKYFGRHGVDELEVLRTSTHRRLTGSAPATPASLGREALFPEAYAVEGAAREKRGRRLAGRVFLLVLALLPLVAYAALYRTYGTLLDDMMRRLFGL